MITLLLFFLAGVAFRFITEWVIEKSKFSIKQQLSGIVLAVAIGFIVAYFGSKANFSGWVVQFIFIAGGFLSKYLTARFIKWVG